MVHPQQQFASTFDQQVDGRNHLDIINKVGPIQKMLTQIQNRCLKIETLTSGTGVVISSKDLNECLEECCRQLIKFGEIEMRTRCEQLSMSQIQYENLIYTKDRQILNLEGKLRSAKLEMNKIVNTKVFSRGNNLIYELDMTTR
jgi:ABC-type cobalamin transport system ATPase subunit